MGVGIRTKAAVNIGILNKRSLSDLFSSELADQKQRRSNHSITKPKEAVSLR